MKCNYLQNTENDIYLLEFYLEKYKKWIGVQGGGGH